MRILGIAVRTDLVPGGVRFLDRKLGHNCEALRLVGQVLLEGLLGGASRRQN